MLPYCPPRGSGGGCGQVCLAVPSPPPHLPGWGLVPKPCTHHLASYIGRCHRSFVRQGCYGCLRNGSCCTGNRGAPPTKRKCYTSGATKSGGGRCQGGAPSPLLQPQPLLYRPPPRSRVWGGDGLAALPSPRASPVPVLSATQASASVKGAGAPRGDHVLRPPLPAATGLRGTSRPLLN